MIKALLKDSLKNSRGRKVRYVRECSVKSANFGRDSQQGAGERKRGSFRWKLPRWDCVTAFCGVNVSLDNLLETHERSFRFAEVVALLVGHFGGTEAFCFRAFLDGVGRCIGGALGYGSLGCVLSIDSGAARCALN